MQRRLTGGCTPVQWAGLGEMRPNSPSASDQLSWGRYLFRSLVFFSVNRIIIRKCISKVKYSGAGGVDIRGGGDRGGNRLVFRVGRGGVESFTGLSLSLSLSLSRRYYIPEVHFTVQFTKLLQGEEMKKAQRRPVRRFDRPWVSDEPLPCTDQ